MAAAYHVWKIWRQEQALQTYHDNNGKSSCKAVQTHLQEMAKAEVREHATLSSRELKSILFTLGIQNL